MYEENDSKSNRFFPKEKVKKEKKKKEKKILKDEVVDETIEVTSEKVLEEVVEPVIYESENQKSNSFFSDFLKKFKKSEDNSSKKQILKIKADWVSIAVKLIFFLLVAFLVIFVVTKLRNQGNTFEENIEKMKEVSYTYYKVRNHRPVTLDEEVVMSLEDMIKASLLPELKDTNNNVCSKEYSYVSLVNRGNDDYDLNIYLSCGGESKSAFYKVNYPSKNNENNTNINDDKEVTKVTLYELKRDVKNDFTYSCPSGYTLSGRYCVKGGETISVSATPKYRVTPEINRPAVQKNYGYEYEYVDPIIIKNEDNLKCPSGYQLKNGKCEMDGVVKYKTQTTYNCLNGGTPSGNRCLFTINATYVDEEFYCKNGEVRDGRCYLKEKYNVRCIYGSYDSSKNACYTTYSSYNKLSDWLFDGIVTFSASKNVEETDTIRYEKVEELSNGKVRYKRYVRINKKTCNNGDILDGRTCKHYDSSYEERYCRNSKYSLTNDKSECYLYENMSNRKIKGTYTCPTGYSKRGSGSNTSCYKYEAAQESTSKQAYCSVNYSLTSDGKCKRVLNPTIVNDEVYTCPDGYSKRGTGSKTQCYKKVKKESYMYCSNSEATLIGDRCVIPEKTELVGYNCPLGYKKFNNTCVKNTAKESILATKNNVDSTYTETIWSKTKELKGWTWTGNTKEEEI